MTSKLCQRVSSVLALVTIVVLLVIVIVVWVQVGNGAFKAKQKYNITVTLNENEIANAARNFKDDGQPYEDFENADDEDGEVVTPSKIGPPKLDDEDDLYDETNDPPTLRHRGGHFRHKAAEAWDQSPEYEIDAFGTKLHLQLFYNDNFVSPNLYITHFFENYTQRVRHDSKVSGCFYTGAVKGDGNSSVAVSLCSGMTGYIHTSDGNYYIEPLDKFRNDSDATFLHRIRRITNRNVDSSRVDGSENGQCETHDKIIIDDDFSVGNVHDRKKRELRFDDIDSAEFAETDDHNSEYKRSPRSPKNSTNAVRRKDHGYFIEILVVADRKMVQYHKTREKLVHYILTLMSHVALLFKHATVGNPISLSIVKILILDHMDFSNPISDVMLQNFCNWQREQHLGGSHDTAFLLTREMICKNTTTGECLTLGIAQVGGMCSPKSSCAIIRDNGLSTSFTIAHELGHLLNMRHDDYYKCSKYNGGVRANNIMSKVLQNDTTPWKWSACSRHYLTEFLDTFRADCLLDRPKDANEHRFSSTLPGEYFEVNRQCELEFGFGSKICSYPDTPKCSSLWCTMGHLEDGGCKTQHMPWADGTKCGNNSWCRHGRCIARKSLPQVHGIWGPWQPWGACSRSCDGGIRISKRNCDSPPPANGGSYCTGGSVRYESCNSANCPDNAVEFREIQCAEFDGHTKGIPGLNSSVKWVPKYGIVGQGDVCRLYCRDNQKREIFELKDRVVDGTKCDLNSYDICVNGICKPGGCDNTLDSKKTLDECGVCNGDNSTCREISGVYNQTHNTDEYFRVARIPKGSSNIVIQQSATGDAAKDDNYLALRDPETDDYILNGNFVISLFLKDIVYGGLKVTYSGSDRMIENITTPRNRKLQQDLIIEVLTMGKTPTDIVYRYTIDKDNAPKYGWHLYNTSWTECDSICNGSQRMAPVCVDLVTNARVSDSKCVEMNIRIDNTDANVVRRCNAHCQLVWNVSSAEHCSVHCGQGIRYLHHYCVLRNTTNQHRSYETRTDDKHCSKLVKPPEYETCHGSCDFTRWEYDDWSGCSKSCGGGVRTRTAKCVDITNKTIGDSHCHLEKKIVQQMCILMKCAVWWYSDWEPCSESCGKGVRRRQRYCTINGKVTDNKFCNQSDLRVISEPCQGTPCSVRWLTGLWSPCSASCGEGIQTREVNCQTSDQLNMKEYHCSTLLKPDREKSCMIEACELPTPSSYHWPKSQNEIIDNSIYTYHGYRWDMGSWTTCTKSCNTGTKSRIVVCRNGSGKESEAMCDLNKKPEPHVRCNEFPCPSWKFGDWGVCNSFCERQRQVRCLDHSGSIVSDNQCERQLRPYSTGKCTSEQCSAGKYQKPQSPKKKIHLVEERKNLRYKWKKGVWGPCTKSCGRGFKTRRVSCRDTVSDVTMVDEYCRPVNKPKMTRYCTQYANCNFTWVEGQWSQCSKTCDEGIKYRNVTCHRVMPGGQIYHTPVIHHHKCDVDNKPATQERCIERNCTDQYSWVAGPWSECNEICGKKGSQRRYLYCQGRKGHNVPKRLCPKQYKPMRKKKCNRVPCRFTSCKDIKDKLKVSTNKDYILFIDGRLATIYCYKMDTRQPEEFISLWPGKENFAQHFSKRLHNTKSCPKYTNAQDCDCSTINPDRYGYTSFWKVRLNITSMQIIANDFTFSTSNGTHQPFGHAGDCYSEVKGCIRGHFSIDLTDTSFRLSDEVRWTTSGNSATILIEKISDRSVRGMCGGNCGNCMPDPNFGLHVEIT